MVGRKENLMKSASPYYAPSSGNTFYFRSIIPIDLRNHFGGKREFQISLKCAIKSRSSKITKSLNRTLARLYDQNQTGHEGTEHRRDQRDLEDRDP